MLQIHLSHSGSYRPGSVISGRVALCSKSPKGESVDVQSVSITFAGRCTTKTGMPYTAKPAHGNVILYAHERLLFREQSTLHAPHQSAGQDRVQHSWPFEFMFPLDCSLAQFPPLSKDSNFEDDMCQSLPSSFKDQDPDPDNLWYAHIAHELVASLTLSKKKLFSLSREIRDTQVLQLIASGNGKATQDGHNARDIGWIRRNNDICPVARPRVGLRMTIRSKVPVMEPMPPGDFIIKCHLPSVCYIGKPLSLALSVEGDRRNPESFVPSKIYLRRVSLQLQTVTLVRGSYGKAAQDNVRDTHQWQSEEPLLAHVFGPPLPLTAEMLDLKQHGAAFILSPYCIPSFKTFNVARNYYISATVVIVADGRTSQPTSTAAAPFKIIGTESGHADLSSRSANTEGRNASVEEPPPAYEITD